jgi:voltage-gated potassium channel
MVFAVIFSAEYAARLWTARESGCSALRWVVTPTAIIDLIAILASVLPFVGANAMLLRLLRVLRMLRIAKLGRFSRAFGVLEQAVRSRASHLIVALMLSVFFLLAGATLMFLIEGESQPDKFGSIPRALWWTAVTMTTVGYGDVVPVSAIGKILASLISLGGIALIAIPTGIMAAAFSDHLAEEERARAEALVAAEAGAKGPDA